MAEHTRSWFQNVVSESLADAQLGHYSVGAKFAAGKRAHTFALNSSTGPPLVAKVPRFFLGTHLQEFDQEVQAHNESTYYDTAGAIPRIKRYVTAGGSRPPVLIMERIGGIAVEQVLNNAPRRFLVASQSGNILRCAELLEQAIGSVAAAGWVHGDPSISNIRLVLDGAQRVTRIYLLDFGSARRTGTAYGKRVFASPGTYAPRQTVPENLASPEDDLFSVGCIVFALATGKWLPRDTSAAAHPQSLNRFGSSKLRPVLARLLSI